MLDLLAGPTCGLSLGESGAKRTPTQDKVVGAEERLAAAWSMMLDAADDTFQSVWAGMPSTVDQNCRIRLAATHATQTAANVATSVFRTTGGAMARSFVSKVLIQKV